MKTLPLFVTTFIGFLWLGAMATPAVAASDLVPILTTPPNGTVGVRNDGPTAAGPTKLLVSCRKEGVGKCPPIPPDQLAAYSDPAFPDQVVVRVPALQPGGRFDHRLTFWNQLCWPAGSYQISAKADAANSESEGNVGEANNDAVSTLVSQRSNCPPDPDAKPDLVPISNGLPQGDVIVWNNGTVAAGPTLLLVSCRKEGGGVCPKIPPDQMAAYSHPDFPDQIVVRVPALQPRTRFDHHLTFWDKLCWRPVGNYVFSARADAGNSEAEGNVGEGNNYVETPPVNRGLCPSPGPSPVDGKPNLRLVPNQLRYGTIDVWNSGTGVAGPNLLRVTCEKNTTRPICPAAFPNQVEVRVPELQPNAHFVYRLTFWDELCWQKPGPYEYYRVMVKVDVENSVLESHEDDNSAYTYDPVSQRNCIFGIPLPPQVPAKPAIPVVPVDPSKPPQATPVPAVPAIPVVPGVPQPIGKQPAK